VARSGAKKIDRGAGASRGHTTACTSRSSARAPGERPAATAAGAAACAFKTTMRTFAVWVWPRSAVSSKVSLKSACGAAAIAASSSLEYSANSAVQKGASA